MDEYVVRIGREPQPAPTVAVPAGAPARRPRMRRRYRRLLAIAVAYLGVHLVAPGAVPQAVDTVVERVRGPIESLEGETQLRHATTALEAGWATHQTYDLTPAELDGLDGLDGAVAWGELVTLEPCHGGTAAVLVARTVRGSISRLLVRGDDVGDVEGAASCPSDLGNPHPWRR